ncbi:DUF1024 family protein [Staphylococcus warneri]|uniref:DUF1024 family protein n=1 Tax=Staphylococcus warneri TaxID=1292 RepID=UPI0032618A33
MTNREQIEQAVISAGAYTGNDTEKLLSELDSVYKKVNVFDGIKDELRTMFIFGYHIDEDTPSKYMNQAYGIVFKKICEKEGTHEFQNLLKELESEE